MSIKIALEAIEVHAEGEPSRVLTSAADLVQGETMAERFDYCRAELEAESDLTGRLHPEWREDDVLHHRVNIAVRSLERTLSIERGRTCQVIHGPHYLP